MLLLLDPSIKAELVSWQHTRIIKSMLYQNAPKLALKYMRVKRLPLQTPEDVKLRLTVLLANGLTAEAYEYQRICRDQLSGDDLLSHLFLACHQSKFSLLVNETKFPTFTGSQLKCYLYQLKGYFVETCSENSRSITSVANARRRGT